MRILHTSDWHLGRSLEGRSRLPEQVQWIDELITIVEEEDIQLILVAGDVYDTYNPSADAEALFFDAVERLSNGGRRAVVVIAGNHDSPERLHAANPLALKYGIALLGYPGEHLPTGGSMGRVERVQTGPGWMEILVPNCPETAMVYALPYPSEARLNEILSANLDDRSQQIAYSQRVGALFAEADWVFRPDTVNLAVAHLFAFGGVESESERQLGGALAVTPGMLPAKAQYIGLGHLHRPQQVHAAAQICRYSGSPLAYSFSEAEQQKEVVIVDVAPGKLPQVKSVNLSCGKSLKRWRANTLEEAMFWCSEPKNLNAWVELEIMVDQPIAATDLSELRRMHPGLVTIRPIFPETLAEMAEARRLSELTLVERFEMFFQRERGVKPEEDLVRFFLEMVNDGNGDSEANDLQATGGEVA